jgi:hypothetical protein
MKNSSPTKLSIAFFAGDALAILLAVLLGLRFHQSEDALLSRILYNWLPWLLAWLAAGWPLGLFVAPSREAWGALGRLLWAALLAAPLATVLRSVWLGTAALPLLVLVMGLASALAILVWRVVYAAIVGRSVTRE